MKDSTLDGSTGTVGLRAKPVVSSKKGFCGYFGFCLSEQNLHKSSSAGRIVGTVEFFTGFTFKRIPSSIFFHTRPVPLTSKTSPQVVANLPCALGRLKLTSPSHAFYGESHQNKQSWLSLSRSRMAFLLFLFFSQSHSLKRRKETNTANPSPVGFVENALVTFDRCVGKKPVTLGILGERSLHNGTPRELTLILR